MECPWPLEREPACSYITDQEMAGQERTKFSVAGKKAQNLPRFSLTEEGFLFWLCGGALVRRQAPTLTPHLTGHGRTS